MRRPTRAGARSAAVPLVAAAIVLNLGVAAYAAWTTNGTGTATSKAGTAQALTTTAAAVTTGLLYPNGPAGSVVVTIQNPNPFPVRVTAVTGNGAVTAAGGIGACATHGVTFTNQTGTWDVAANGSATVTLAGAATMSSASENGCQGATFTIPVSLTGASN